MKLRNKLATVFAMSLIALGATNAEAAVSKAQRRLVVVSNLKTFGMAKYEWLYKFLDAQTISMAQMFLGGQYNTVYALHPSVAKRGNFRAHLKSITNKTDVKAVDVILSLHGADNAIWFEDGKTTMADVEADLKTVTNRSKLRMVYNLACYGASHRDEFRNGGFRTAIGSRKVNTASASEFPEFLGRFGNNHKVNEIIAATNASPLLATSDFVAKSMGFSDPDSRKLISGKTDLRITYNAQ